MDDRIRKATSILGRLPFVAAVSARDSLRDGQTPESTRKLADGAAQLIDRLTLEILEQFGRKPVCQKGCSYCCHLLVVVTIPEILAIAQHVRENFTLKERETLLRAIDTALAATKGLSRKERMDTRVPCPLLKEGSCSVYDNRPLPCRSYHSFDVEECKRDFEDPAARHTIGYNNLAASVGATAELGISVALDSQRLDGRNLDLIRALKIAMEDPSLLSTWGSRPSAFDAAAMAHAHPDSAFDRKSAKQRKELGRQITNSPAWKSSG
jgi:Fe-S-cluster containining protein